MQVKPMRPCRQPGCPNLTSDKSGYCPGCLTQSRKENDATRPNANARGYNARWERYAKTFLAAHPLCQTCLKKEPPVIEASECVDHIIPAKPWEPLFWDQSNHQALSNRCHSIKTATEDGAFGNAIKSNG